ncbi:Spy/CpxP family protein refolding chaperone [Enterovirga aerilata]|uniref:Spy/CpxP family protein refolding chaperone n=1 Tax=Enterovirga aerilata TaxID=2730920 RepID=A0A849IAQ3_9HYPH|nr:Spy/CpxP family protein refolding chaperone [Enterovirga sp. DB1703]NNM71033.1 Spy/CpxP family protein refolding chaperone [Enterovirga sp. DB1703]
MKRWLIGLSGVGALAAATAVYAQDRGFPGGPFDDGPGWRRGGPLSAEDRAAFTDARIAALRAGLKLTPAQENLWPPVEEAIRGLATQRQEARQARRERFASMRQDGAPRDVPDTLRFMADRQAASADALRKLADAAQPLYASLDEGQKRRLSVLSRSLVRGVAGHHRRHGPGPHGEGPMRRG